MISELSVSERRIYLRGRTSANLISFSSELGTRSVTPVGETGDFEVDLEGSVQLALRIDGEPKQYPVRTKTHLQSLANVITSTVALVCVLGQWRDIRDYMIYGDSGAGDRLEYLLDPHREKEALPIAKRGLFSGDTTLNLLSQPVDIVVPVFNAYEDTTRCLERLAKHTNLIHRMHIVDDCSTDQRTRQLVEAWCAKRENTSLTVNEKNLGFVKSVNIGLMQARGHVVLLNTDAFVPEGWLERLLRPILEDSNVASTTPMSSNAEILTAPVSCSRFEPSSGRADAIDAIARQLNPNKAVADLPTGVGFCMALSKSWLEKIPQLDVAFGRGYGEEVDWCRKVAQLGARHIGIGNLYVEHRGGRSFEAEKLERVRVNNRKIDSRYPGYDQLVEAFRKTDPLIAPRLVLAIASIDTGGPVSVYISQRVGGGSEAWLNRQIEDHLEIGNGCIVIRDGPKAEFCTIEVHTPSGQTSGAVAFEELKSYLTVAERLWINYSGLVTSRAPLAFLENCLAIMRACDRLSVYFHDFFPVCPSYNLISADGEFCALPQKQPCQTCYSRLGQTSGQRPELISEWRHRWMIFLRRAEELVTFSEDSAALICRVWPELAKNVTIRAHEPLAVPRLVKKQHTKVPVLGVLGCIGYNKGADVLKSVAKVSKGRFRIVVIGKLDPAFRHRNIEVHGSYEQSQISDLAELYGVSCWFVPSIWPETYCFAAHECLATGLPVLSFDIGAHAEAIATHRNGMVLPITMGPEEIADALLRTDSLHSRSSQ